MLTYCMTTKLVKYSVTKTKIKSYMRLKYKLTTGGVCTYYYMKIRTKKFTTIYPLKKKNM